jgi:ferredoxin-type protein NapF
MAWLKMAVRLKEIRTVSLVIALLLALPLGWGWASGLYLWLSPFVMLNSVLVLRSVVWLNGIAVILLLFSLLKKRWFCHYLCPVGYACDKCSTLGRRKAFVLRKLPPLGKWIAAAAILAALAGFPALALLDPLVIFNGFFTVFSQEPSLPVLLSMLGLPILLTSQLLFPGSWCARICPLGGLLDLDPVFKKSAEKPSLNKELSGHLSRNRRRLFLASGAGLAIGLTLPGLLKASVKPHFRPPGSVEADLYNLLCLRCGSCIKACPSNILFQRSEFSDPMTWMTPEISFKKGYCMENCNLCSQACPSGAITLFDPKAKKELVIGLAELQPENCLLLKQTECDRCKVACPYEAIAIDTKNSFQTLPVIDQHKCTGCGACAVICPPETIRMIPLS